MSCDAVARCALLSFVVGCLMLSDAAGVGCCVCVNCWSLSIVVWCLLCVVVLSSLLVVVCWLLLLGVR